MSTSAWTPVDESAAASAWTPVDETPKHDFSSLTANPKREGTYQIKTQDGQTIGVPYSNVPIFTQGLQGSSFASPEEQKRFETDAANDPHRPTFWNALTNPIGSGAWGQNPGSGALQVGGQAINTMAQPFVHPIDTAVGLAKMGGAIASGNPYTAGQEIAAPMAQKYLADQQQGGNALALENLAGQALGTYEGGRMTSAAADTVGPPITRAVGKGAQNVAESLYGNALKPSTTLSAADRTAMINTGLRENIPVSPKGLESLGDLIDTYNKKIQDVINSDPNRPIDPNAVAARTTQTSQRFANQVVAKPDLDAIEAQRQQFLTERGARPATPPQPTGVLNAQGQPIMTPGTPAQPAPGMAAADAQAMKQGTYNILRGKYGEQGSAVVEAQKALARGLKEEIAAQFPEITKLNAGESQLINLGPSLERAVNRISNNHTIGIGGPIAGTAIKAMTGSSGVAGVAGLLKSVIDIPAVKSNLAIAISRGAQIPYPQALARVLAYSASLGSSAPDSQEYSTGRYSIPGQP